MASKIHVYAIMMQKFSYLNQRGVVQQEYSQPPLKYSKRTPPPLFFLIVTHHGSRQPPLHSGRTAFGTLLQTEYPPPPGL